ncbi:radical SAM/CxCxxxxC motif protein YfkAB [Paenibacillus selenitireducens]|uniref:Radical SAM/CxCxxxxC motif protein YfkAB n=1 Tax=Paenibacillus selenitireducens TaxID=1324314 RepID=A0A1T2XLV4_9BACL|nr:radical SAM/CxCxxxxC motif protein YfkAB [Paenibacillus selenitireducens]OPA80831.1 radical SAM/CxCxxxxC motif protein YfkAB [Paenibacillus selenitireducens]
MQSNSSSSIGDTISLQPLSPVNDPWDPIRSLQQYGKHVLTSVEFTITNLCNMRCEHCAVGDTLTLIEPDKIPLTQLLKRLDEVEHLETISITGGEPSFHMKTVHDYIVPLLKYARERGVRSQINSNLTLDYKRYAPLLPYLDVMHISFNYVKPEDFHEVGFKHSGHAVSLEAATKLYDRMIENTRRLSSEGMFISAESMINYRTHRKMSEIHELIVDMGCLRHEVHPMYPSSFAVDLPMLSQDEMRASIHQLLDVRHQDIWMLFGTLPFYACNTNEADQHLLRRLRTEPNVTLRNDPDGRNRVNVNAFTGDVFVTDFADIPSFGNIEKEPLDQIFDRWLSEHPLNQRINCHCSSVSCCGPNLLVADMYYKNEDFKTRKAII